VRGFFHGHFSSARRREIPELGWGVSTLVETVDALLERRLRHLRKADLLDVELGAHGYLCLRVRPAGRRALG
jgi:hypothetical protein